MVTVQRLAIVFGLIGPFFSVGCGGDRSGEFATISGVVTQGGTPVDGAKLTFHATVETKGQRDAYSAITDSSGKYLLLTMGKDPGIPPGMYKVTITKQGFKDNKPAGTEMDAGQMDAQLSASVGMAKNSLPKEYELPASTKLSTTLNVGKNEKVNFDLPK